jgi:hypothetical protein
MWCYLVSESVDFVIFLGGNMILTGDVIEAYHRNYLNADLLNKWALVLLESGFEWEAIPFAASCPDLSWHEVPVYLRRILRELGVAVDIDDNIEKIKEDVFLQEYQIGKRSEGELLKKFDRLRKEIGFSSMIGFTIVGDEYEGESRSGYHTLDRRLYGEDLEKWPFNLLLGCSGQHLRYGVARALATRWMLRWLKPMLLSLMISRYLVIEW